MEEMDDGKLPTVIEKSSLPGGHVDGVNENGGDMANIGNSQGQIIQNNPSTSATKQTSSSGKKNDKNNGSKKGRKRSRKKFNCRWSGCELPDNDKMVQCDDCNKWYHYDCVGVDDTVASRPWKCFVCTKREEVLSVSDASTLSSSSSRRQLKLSCLEEAKKLQDKLLDEEKQLKERRVEEERLAKAKIDEEYLAQRRKNDEEFINSKYDLDSSDMASSISLSTNSSLLSSLRRTQKWAQDHKDLNQKLRNQGVQTKNHKNSDPKTQSTLLHSNTTMSASHLAARQVLGRIDLPLFNGDPLDWPMFISAFNHTTEQCSYTNGENLLRLQKSLRGEAMDLVRSSLVFAESVPSIITSLQQMYGQPEVILSRLVKRIRGMPAIKAERFDMLIRFSIEAKNLYATIAASQLTEHLNNPMLRQELVDKLPQNLKLDWGFHRQKKKRSDLAEFIAWLGSVAEAASLSTPDIKPADTKQLELKETELKRKGVSKKFEQRLAVHKSVPTESLSGSEMPCVVCGSTSHKIDSCTEFLSLPPGKRIDKTIQLRLCRTCLGKHSSYCTVNKRCDVDGCRRFHNPLLHKTNSQESNFNSETRQEHAARQSTHQRIASSILYRIVPVYLYGPSKRISTFALFDEGSTGTLLEESVAKELDIVGPMDDLKLKWTGEISRVEENSMVISLDIAGMQTPDMKYRIRGINTVRNLDLPIQAINTATLDRYRHLENISIPNYENGRPTILIGLDQYKLSMPLEIREGGWEEPIATRTRLGWTICGPNQKAIRDYRFNIHKMESSEDSELHAAVKDFFSIENFGVNPVKLVVSKDDERAKDLMARTTKYRDGRYETGLLWRYDSVKLPKSRDMAFRRLCCFENKLLKNDTLKNAVNEKICEYEAKGYARKLNANEAAKGPRIWYLPIFVVHNANKPSKLRLVWDAAAKSNGVALNDFLLKGPDQLSPLLEVLFRFRQKRVAISGDLKEMFHQVLVSEEDRDAQRFLWRNCDASKEPEEYIMRVMTFGATCSPSLAQYVKNTHAQQYVEQFPRAVKAIQANHYVDDWLDSFDTAEETIRIAKEVRNIHSAGGFEIRNWLCNDQAVLNALGDEKEQSPYKRLTSFEGGLDKVLGMWWLTSEDVLVFCVNYSRVNENIMNGTRAPTKREALSTVMSTFDPLGLIASFIVYGKIILQEVWRQGTDWDENINDEANCKWKSWIQKLQSIEQLRIPRNYIQKLRSDRDIIYDLHIFVDASEEAYSAIAYLRACYRDDPDDVECTLVSSKTRVAPQKPLSIPRLELLAAVLGVRLLNTIVKSHTLKFNSRTIWSDSSTVLSWMRSDARRYKPFVALRVSECLESTSLREWRYVPSKMNVADEATKWYASLGLTTVRWFDGPDFLLQESSLWPNDLKKGDSIDELRPHLFMQLSHIAKSRPTIVTIDVEYTKSWTRMIRYQVCFQRSVTNFHTNQLSRPANAYLTLSELRQAENTLLRKAQEDVYKDEIATLSMDPTARVESTSPIYRYSPYMDQSGLIRMRGRIDKATCTRPEAKRPVIIPKDHAITHALIAHYHHIYLHQNHETIINEIRQKFVVPNLRVVYRQVRANCQRCKVKAATPRQPEMADLPADRLAVNVRPFTNVGIDYFGPLEVVIGRRTEKRWGVLYTCLSIRAVHLELVNSLSTDSCIRSLVMFKARRGTPRRIYSDNATNFRGANNVLQAELRKLNSEELADRFSNIEWRFIPPGSPHFGGAWERLVRVVKTNLYASLPDRKPSDEILRACLAEVEAIVNSRPLTHIPIEAEESDAITPNHLILGSSSGEKPLCAIDEDYLPTTNSWKISQMFADRFWRRFIREYLPDLARRTKWYTPAKPLQVGDLVFVIDERNVRGDWPRGTQVAF